MSTKRRRWTVKEDVRIRWRFLCARTHIVRNINKTFLPQRQRMKGNFSLQDSGWSDKPAPDDKIAFYWGQWNREERQPFTDKKLISTTETRTDGRWLLSELLVLALHEALNGHLSATRQWQCQFNLWLENARRFLKLELKALKESEPNHGRCYREKGCPTLSMTI